jgi:hypothetical protein
LQSETPRWSNFSGRQVIGPGVAAAVQESSGPWWLYFNGFSPKDMPVGPNGKVEGAHRRHWVCPCTWQFLRLHEWLTFLTLIFASWAEPE